MKILYIMGATRSGSTLLHDALAQMDGFEGVGEMRDIWQYGMLENRLCGCGTPFRSCEFWSSTLDHAFGSTDQPDVPGLAALTERFRTRHLLFVPGPLQAALIRDMSPLLDALARIYSAIEQLTGCRVIVDSSKNPAFGYLLGTCPGFDVRYVHLVRDAPAVAHSLGKHKESEPGRQLPRKTALQASADWCLRNLAIDHRFRHHPFLARVRYEDFVADPHRTVLSARRLVSEPDEPLGFIEGDVIHTTVRPHSVFGNPGRFRVGPVVVRCDGAWREELARGDAAIVRALTRPLRSRYGYTRRRERTDPDHSSSRRGEAGSDMGR